MLPAKRPRSELSGGGGRGGGSSAAAAATLTLLQQLLNSKPQDLVSAAAAIAAPANHNSSNNNSSSNNNNNILERLGRFSKELETCLVSHYKTRMQEQQQQRQRLNQKALQGEALHRIYKQKRRWMSTQTCFDCQRACPPDSTLEKCLCLQKWGLEKISNNSNDCIDDDVVDDERRGGGSSSGGGVMVCEDCQESSDKYSLCMECNALVSHDCCGRSGNNLYRTCQDCGSVICSSCLTAATAAATTQQAAAAAAATVKRQGRLFGCGHYSCASCCLMAKMYNPSQGIIMTATCCELCHDKSQAAAAIHDECKTCRDHQKCEGTCQRVICNKCVQPRLPCGHEARVCGQCDYECEECQDEEEVEDDDDEEEEDREE